MRENQQSTNFSKAGRIFLAFVFIITATLNSFAQTSQQHITTSDGVSLYVKRSGSGVPCLFLHGGPGSTSLYFEKEGGNVLEKEVEMIYLDQRGSGRSGNLENDPFEMDRLIADLEEVREQLGIESWIVMAHSFGGFLGIEYAHRHPEHIKGFIMLNALANIHTAIDDQTEKIMEMLGLTEETAGFDPEMNALSKMFFLGGKLKEKGRFHELMFDSPEAKAVDDSVMNTIPLNWKFAQHAFNDPVYFKDYYPLTKEIKIPVLVVSGTRDYAVGPKHHEGMLFPNMTLKEVEGGHALYLEHNDAFYQAVSPFLKKLTTEEKN